MNIERLVRMSTYARMKGKSKELVRLNVNSGKLKHLTIDDTVFVVLSEKELNELKKQ